MLQLAEEMREDPRTWPTTKCARLDAIFFPVLFKLQKNVMQRCNSFGLSTQIYFLLKLEDHQFFWKSLARPLKKQELGGWVGGLGGGWGNQETSADVTKHDFVAEVRK